MYAEYSQTNNVKMVLVSGALTWFFFFAFKIYRQWLKSQKNLAILKLFFSAKFNLCFIHVVEWAVVNKFECWIFSCTFGIIFHLDHYSALSWAKVDSCFFYLSLDKLNFVLLRSSPSVMNHENKKCWILSGRMWIISNLIYIWIILLQAKWPNQSIEMNFPFLFLLLSKR